jgi:hypothetical protein
MALSLLGDIVYGDWMVRGAGAECKTKKSEVFCTVSARTADPNGGDVPSSVQPSVSHAEEEGGRSRYLCVVAAAVHGRCTKRRCRVDGSGRKEREGEADLCEWIAL